MRLNSIAGGVVFIIGISLFGGVALGQCPPKEKIEAVISKFEAQDRSLVAIQPTEYPGLCEVQVRLNNRIHIFYTGAKGDYLLMGQLYDSLSGRNLTREKLEHVNLFSPEEMNQLKELAAITIGASGKVIYYATDPHCPYCKQGEEILKRMAQSGDLTVRILFFPLESYKDSREISISVICDKKSLDDFHGGYTSKNQCAEGIGIIDKTKELLSRKGVTGTPTYIFPDQRYHSGLLDEAELRRRLGLTANPGGDQKPSAQKKK
ncbi:MAG: DsbC family protein [Desulfobacterales bacterium]